MKQKPVVIGAVVIAIILAIVGGVFAFKTRTSQPEEEQTTERPARKPISQPVNEISVSERPWVSITPKADGRNLSLTVHTVAKSATTAEYELEYQAGTLLQGAFGLLDLATVPSSEEILLGSCSAGGACTFHEDIKGGTLVLSFEGDESYALKQEWRYFDNWGNAETQFASKDSKFQLESSDLAKQRFVVIYNSPGYPEGLEGTPVSDPYSLTGSSAIAGTADLTMRATEEGDLTIMGFDGESWTSFETSTDGKTATAEVTLMDLYIVVQ